jgi:positive regulator of sigma E activity
VDSAKNAYLKQFGRSSRHDCERYSDCEINLMDCSLLFSGLFFYLFLFITLISVSHLCSSIGDGKFARSSSFKATSYQDQLGCLHQ